MLVMLSCTIANFRPGCSQLFEKLLISGNNDIYRESILAISCDLFQKLYLQALSGIAVLSFRKLFSPVRAASPAGRTIFQLIVFASTQAA